MQENPISQTIVKWISMNEREPIQGRNYLVTVTDPFDSTKLYVTDDDYFSYGWDNWGNDVIAWAEKPEPYRKDDSE